MAGIAVISCTAGVIEVSDVDVVMVSAPGSYGNLGRMFIKMNLLSWAAVLDVEALVLGVDIGWGDDMLLIVIG